MKAKIRYIAVGECPRCRTQFVRPPECTAAVCDCQNPNPTLIPLAPALLLPTSIYKRYAKIAQLAGVPLEKLINEVLKEAARQKLEKLDKKQKPFPQLTVITKK
jgi:hypothetical protein